jgi:hypothetical protein
MSLARHADLPIPSSVRERIVFTLLHVIHVVAVGQLQPSSPASLPKSERGRRLDRSLCILQQCSEPFEATKVHTMPNQ